MEEVELEVELRDKIFSVSAEVHWDEVPCECSSDCGDQWVTERWNEIQVNQVNITSLNYFTDSDEFREIPTNALSKEDRLIINEAIQEHIQNNL